MDRRVEKTKSAIKHEVINSLNTNEIEKITVKSICDKININRSTFYLHYSTINDVIDEIGLYIDAPGSPAFFNVKSCLYFS